MNLLAKPVPSIPLGAAVVCLDCRLVFHTGARACPGCGSEIGAFRIENGQAATIIRQQRELLATVEGILLTLAKRRLGPSSLLAWRGVEYIRNHNEKAPAGTGAPVTEREVAAS